MEAAREWIALRNSGEIPARPAVLKFYALNISGIPELPAF